MTLYHGQICASSFIFPMRFAGSGGTPPQGREGGFPGLGRGGSFSLNRAQKRLPEESIPESFRHERLLLFLERCLRPALCSLKHSYRLQGMTRTTLDTRYYYMYSTPNHTNATIYMHVHIRSPPSPPAETHLSIVCTGDNSADVQRPLGLQVPRRNHCNLQRLFG